MSATSTPVATVVKKSLGWPIGLSVLMIVAGLLSIVMPPAAGVAIAVLVGWLLVFSVSWSPSWLNRTGGPATTICLQSMGRRLPGDSPNK